MPASIKHLTDKKINLSSLLARWKDGLYYTAAIVRCDKTNKRCLVCFEDGSEVWVNNRDIHIQLSLDQLNEDEDIVCCICDDGSSEPPNEIILCDVCQQGYHQKCHNPPVDSSKIDETDDTSDHKDWFCATCSYILNQSDRAKLSEAAHQQQQQQQQKQQQEQKQKLQQSQSKQSPPQPQTKPKSQQPQPQKPQQNQHAKPQPPQPTKSPQAQQPEKPIQAQQQVSPQPIQKQSSKSKPQTSVPQTQQTSTIGPVKASVDSVQKPAPYYPLSNQARVVATSSTAALASMTASSALVVGSSSGRTKQDLVNQSNRSSQRQRPPTANVEAISAPVKHAVRKSSVNFVMPARQSALPTATRSVLPDIPPPPKVPNLIATTATAPTQPNSKNNNSSNNNGVTTIDAKDKQPQVSPQAPPSKKLASWTMSTQGLIITPPTPTIKSNEISKDSPSITSSSLSETANNACKPVAMVESKVSVTSSTSPPASTTSSSKDGVSGSSIIVTPNRVQPTVIVTADSKKLVKN